MKVSDSTNTPNLEDLVRLGIRTAKAGNKEGARVMFQKVLDVDKRNERAWLWMASLADNDTDRRRYLETVLAINGNNTGAQKYLNAMNQANVGGDRASVMLGVKILLFLLVALVVVAVIALVISRIS